MRHPSMTVAAIEADALGALRRDYPEEAITYASIADGERVAREIVPEYAQEPEYPDDYRHRTNWTLAPVPCLVRCICGFVQRIRSVPA